MGGTTTIIPYVIAINIAHRCVNELSLTEYDDNSWVKYLLITKRCYGPIRT